VVRLGRVPDRLRHLERISDNAQFLADFSKLLSRSADVGGTLESTVRLLVPRAADMATVHLFDDIGVLRRAALAHRDSDTESKLAGPAEEGIEARSALLRLAATGGRTVLLPAQGTSFVQQVALDEGHASILRKLGIVSALAVPLVARGETLGLLGLIRLEGSDPFDETDMSLAEEVGARAALAVDNALLHERQARVARALQAGLLPPIMSDLPGVEVAATFHPAGEGVEVGGDFYDLFSVDEGRWALMIGDVSGSGPGAAALTSQVRHGARVAARAGLSASEVVSAVNRSLDETSGSEWFCTMVYAELSVHEGGADLQITCAGHPPPLVMREGTVEEVGVQGPLLGVLPLANFAVRSTRLGPGHAIVMVTDGAVEARSGSEDTRGELFGQERLVAVLERCSGQPASAVVKAVADEVLEFSGGLLADDLAVLVVRAEPRP
jgi:serine phosphatase RsbU (regulator of sigma subunit)